ncbi:MAG: inositol monophosphatase family protein [Nanoarchaeota archaeon]|nr:inositol monophosphatase family protein [Nanoarchaeota archaeon]
MNDRLRTLERVAVSALFNANKIHDALGKVGEEIMPKNQFGDTALRADIEAENAVMEVFRNNKIPIRFFSEEHGTVDLCKNPSYLGVLDGLDGSVVYKSARGKDRYGTMLGVFAGANPSYDDYLFSGIIEHSTKKLYFAIRGMGSYVMENEKSVRIACSGQHVLDKNNTLIYADEMYDRAFGVTIIKDTFLSKLREFHFLNHPASEVHYVDLAFGDADLVLDCTRKNNLEIAAAYGLVREAGGVMMTLDGKSIGLKKYLEFGQKENIPVVSAATEALANALIRQIE